MTKSKVCTPWDLKYLGFGFCKMKKLLAILICLSLMLTALPVFGESAALTNEEAFKEGLQALMNSIANTVNRTYAYEHRNGTRPTPPWLQQHITAFCRQHGWQGPVEFDAYDEQYEW